MRKKNKKLILEEYNENEDNILFVDVVSKITSRVQVNTCCNVNSIQRVMDVSGLRM